MVVSKAAAVPLLVALAVLAVSQNWLGAHDVYTDGTSWVAERLGEVFGGGFASAAEGRVEQPLPR